jgi:tRNA-dihydrouridine synthase B
MVGRAANGRPWWFKQAAHYLATGESLTEPDAQIIHEVIHRHVCEMHQFYGEVIGVRMARKHLAWYAPYLALSAEQRRCLMVAEVAELQLAILLSSR